MRRRSEANFRQAHLAVREFHNLLFRKDDPLRAQFNEVIDALKRDATTRRLYERWFGAPPDPLSAVVRVVPEITAATCGGARPQPARGG